MAIPSPQYDRPRARIRFLRPHWARVEAPAGDMLKSCPPITNDAGPLTFSSASRAGLVEFRRGGAILPGGLVDAAACALNAMGYEVDVAPVRWMHYESSPPLPAGTFDEDELQATYAATIENRGRALVIAASLEQQARLLAVICRRFTAREIVAVVANTDEAELLAATMRPLTDRVVSCGMLYDEAGRNELHILSTRSFALPPLCDVVVAMGTKAACSSRVQDLTARYRNCMRFAIVEPSVTTLRPWDRLLGEAMWGPCLLDLTKRSPWPSTVHAALLPAPAYPATRSHCPYEKKLQLLWKNLDRNRQLAATAAALQRREQHCLQAAGIDRLDDVAKPADPASPTLRVAVVVESSLHGRQLQTWLPSWRLVADVAAAGPLGIEAEAHIVTLPVAAAVGLIADVVIYAAGSGDVWIPACGSGGVAGSRMQLVVDMADDGDVELAAEVHRRTRDYAARGWTVHASGGRHQPALSACRPLN
ncbi:hypothetical protein I41_36660 [Lacipirellula limnantheis]|uniref:Uncharacterized protein n=2 Tax=Lacipirellula limnantheis TaxID=2528024 RepID=A0A517U1G7_9BACT|nr:hypothetical protein I41_36660 [Lacipirellula limnantheis]